MSDPLHALRRAIAAIKAGDKVGGQRLLAEVIRNDPRNEAAWLWLSAALDSDEQRRICLERVLSINPGNQAAQQGLARLGPTFGRTGPTFGRTSPTSQPPGPSSPGTGSEPVPPPARPSAGRTAHRARAVLPWWSLLIAFGATIVVCATVGIAAYLALSGVVGAMRQLVRLAGGHQEAANE